MTKQKAVQPSLIENDTNLLPLFCGVPQEVQAENFAPKETGTQLKLIQFRFEDVGR